MQFKCKPDRISRLALADATDSAWCVNHGLRILYLFGLATITVFLLFAWEGKKGFSLWDEGFLWYGAQRVMLGEIPLRDFQSYDPGRYYWSAALMYLWGDNGIMALRSALAVFQTAGLFVALLTIDLSAKRKNMAYLFLSVITLATWMFPRHKLFDISLSIILIGAISFLVSKPTPRRYFMTGMCVGLVATFGRNHGVYGAVACLGVMVWLAIKREDKPRAISALVVWGAGVAAGFLPVLLMVVLLPGFGVEFLESVRLLVENRATNITLPIPWPWRVQVSSLPLDLSIPAVLVGIFFFAIMMFGVLSILWVFRRRLQSREVSPTFVATTFLALPYAHYAYSRADVGHLALGIFPMLVGCMAAISNRSPMIKWPIALVLCSASLWATCMSHPGWQCYLGKECVSVEISGSSIAVDRATANDIALLREMDRKYAPGGGNFIAAPYWPGAYALLGRKCPTWEIYPLLPMALYFQQSELARIIQARPVFALILDIPLDGRNELRYRNTHPLVHQYLVDHFERVRSINYPSLETFVAK